MNATEHDTETSAPKARRRREILDAATAVFAERGYHAAGIKHIIDRAGIARGTFYLYFESKHNVLAAILDEAMTELSERIEPVDIEPGSEPPRVQMVRQIERVLGYLMARRALCRLLLSPGLSPNDEVAERVGAFYAHLSEMIQRSIGHGIAWGLVRTRHPELLAEAILGAARGVVGSVLAADAPPPLSEVAEDFVTFVVGGAIADPTTVA